MMSYLIIDERELNLTLEVLIFKNQLTDQWGEITFENTRSIEKLMVLSWRISNNGKILLGFLHNDRATITLDGVKEEVANFSIWFRSLVSKECRLFLCHDQDPEMMIELQMESTKEEILDSLNKLQ